jgi:uncharacterized protein (DUF427 family)
MQAWWNGRKIADSNDIIKLEGNIYFPPESVEKNLLAKSKTTSICPWKGKAFYFDLIVNGQVNKDAAWFYPEPSEEAIHIKNYIAFWKGAVVKD